MPNVRQILVEWSTTNGAPGVSVFYFDAAAAVSTQRDELEDFLNVVAAYLDNGTHARILSEGKEFDAATGTLTGIWNEGTDISIGGVNTNGTVVNAAQLLVRWNTGQIVSGRVLKGRTFIPGLARNVDVDGEVDGDVAFPIQTAAQVLADSAASLLVWHRPKNSAGGQFHTVQSASVWSEWAVLRHRR